MLQPDLDGYWTEICACGHPVNRHVLTGTEYCRCESWPGECPCAGGSRVAILVREDIANPSGVNTNSRFFRRRFSPDAVHPLTGGVEKTSREDVIFEWAVADCDMCGQDWNEMFYAYWADSEGKPQWKMTEVTGRTLLLCGICNSKFEWANS